MNLKEVLYSYCESNNLNASKDIICNSFLDYCNKYTQPHNSWLNISPIILSSYCYAVNEKIFKELLLYLYDLLPHHIEIDYIFNCKNEVCSDMFGVSIPKNDFVENQVYNEPCLRCNNLHSYTLDEDNYVLNFSIDSTKFLKDLNV